MTVFYSVNLGSKSNFLLNYWIGLDWIRFSRWHTASWPLTCQKQKPLLKANVAAAKGWIDPAQRGFSRITSVALIQLADMIQCFSSPSIHPFSFSFSTVRIGKMSRDKAVLPMLKCHPARPIFSFSSVCFVLPLSFVHFSIFLCWYLYSYLPHSHPLCHALSFLLPLSVPCCLSKWTGCGVWWLSAMDPPLA